jgi:tetratricopeptide (TPR) repeat protein
MIEKYKDAFRKGDLEKAIEYGKQAVEMYPNNFDSYFCLRKAYHRMRQPELAYENFKKAEELASSKEDLASCTVQAKRNMGKYNMKNLKS